MIKKETWIIIGVVIAVIIGILLMIKYLPLYVTIIGLVAFGVGGIGGWYSRVMYDKYIINKGKNEAKVLLD
jgi:uncharacterized membrane protein